MIDGASPYPRSLVFQSDRCVPDPQTEKPTTNDKNTYKTVTSTGATPGPVNPMVSAAAWERSTSRPSM